MPSGHSLVWCRGRTTKIAVVVVPRIASSAGATAVPVAIAVIVGTAAHGTAPGRWRQHGSFLMVLLTIIFVTFFERRQFFWLGGIWGVAEVRVLQGVMSVDSAPPVQLEKLSK